MHCEPAPGGPAAGPGGALVIIQPAPAAPAHPGPDLLSEAATRIGTTLDLTRTAREVTEVAVPAFAAAATIFVSEPLLAADDVAARRAESAAVVRRLAARLAGQPPAAIRSRLATPRSWPSRSPRGAWYWAARPSPGPPAIPASSPVTSH